MSTLLEDEKFIRESFLHDDAATYLTWGLFLLHFTAIDKVENTSHCKAISYLYQIKNKKYTKQGIADKIYTNVKTFKNDRKQYAAYFFFFYDYIRNGEFSAESAIAALFRGK